MPYAHKNTGRPADNLGPVITDMINNSSYLDEANEPLFPFGHGLGYTRFEYGDLVVETPRLGLGDTLAVSVTVSNVGERAGDEVVQLYVRDLVGSVSRPVKELKAFQRITLEAGESRSLQLEVPVQALGFHGLDMAYRVEAGAFRLWVGPNAAEGLEGAFEVTE